MKSPLSDKLRAEIDAHCETIVAANASLEDAIVNSEDGCESLCVKLGAHYEAVAQQIETYATERAGVEQRDDARRHNGALAHLARRYRRFAADLDPSRRSAGKFAVVRIEEEVF